MPDLSSYMLYNMLYMSTHAMLYMSYDINPTKQGNNKSCYIA